MGTASSKGSARAYPKLVGKSEEVGLAIGIPKCREAIFSGRALPALPLDSI
jgi:hypothetical protein